MRITYTIMVLCICCASLCMGSDDSTCRQLLKASRESNPKVTRVPDERGKNTIRSLVLSNELNEAIKKNDVSTDMAIRCLMKDVRSESHDDALRAIVNCFIIMGYGAYARDIYSNGEDYLQKKGDMSGKSKQDELAEIIEALARVRKTEDGDN